MDQYVNHGIEENFKNSDDEYEDEIILVCSICFSQYHTEDDLKQHFINDHGYVRKTNTLDYQKQMNQEIMLNPITKAKDYKKPDYNGLNVIEEEKMDKNGDVSSEEAEIEDVPIVAFKEFKLILRKLLTQKCPIKGCLFKFETKEKLDSHIKCHLYNDSETRDFKCIICNLEMKSWRNCTLHLWKSHQIDIDMLKCPECPYKAITATKIWRHMKIHKKWRSKVLKTMKKPNSKERKDASELAATRWYSQKTCQICTRKFSNAKILSKHIKAVHNKIKPFICNVCGRKSARKSTWKIHMRQHTGEKPLQCKVCPFRASDPSVLKKHEVRHNKDISKYCCELCSYKSIQSVALKLHMKTTHPEEYKKLCCDQCKYVSVSSKFLEAHKKDHKKGLITNEDSLDAIKIPPKPVVKPTTNMEISSDCFLPLESTDSIAHDPSIDTGGVTIPAHSEEAQFPN